MPLSITKKMQSFLNEQSLDEATTLPAEMYTERRWLDIDNNILLASQWQLVGSMHQLQNVGDQIVTHVAGKPVVVVLNQQQEIKAFYNVCRHRAGPVATENGNSLSLRCKYHGWTYNLDGQLKMAPEMNTTPDFDVCQYHLPEVQVDVWENFIFVCLQKTSISLQEIFSGIKDNIRPIDISKMQFHHRQEYVIDCNWKVYMDNYLEGYHLPHVHPGLSKLLDYRTYDTKLYKWYSYQFSPLESSENFYDEGKAHYYCVFPNLMLNILPGRLQTNLILPVSENTCKVIFDYYYTDLDTDKTRKMILQDLEFSDQIQEEDITICQYVQKGLGSGSYEAGRLCNKRETGVYHYQELIRKVFREAISSDRIIIEL